MELVTTGSEIMNLKQELNSVVEIPKIARLNEPSFLGVSVERLDFAQIFFYKLVANFRKNSNMLTSGGELFCSDTSVTQHLY